MHGSEKPRRARFPGARIRVRDHPIDLQPLINLLRGEAFNYLPALINPAIELRRQEREKLHFPAALASNIVFQKHNRLPDITSEDQLFL